MFYDSKIVEMHLNKIGQYNHRIKDIKMLLLIKNHLVCIGNLKSAKHWIK